GVAAATVADPRASTVISLGDNSEAEANLAEGALLKGAIRSSTVATAARVSPIVCVTDGEPPLGTEAPCQRKPPKIAPIASAHTIAARRMATSCFDSQVRFLCANLHVRVKIDFNRMKI